FCPHRPPRPSFPTRRSSDLAHAHALPVAPSQGSEKPPAAQELPPEEPLGFTWWNDNAERIRRGNERYMQDQWDRAEDYYRGAQRSEEHTSELQSRETLVCRP